MQHRCWQVAVLVHVALLALTLREKLGARQPLRFGMDEMQRVTALCYTGFAGVSRPKQSVSAKALYALHSVPIMYGHWQLSVHASLALVLLFSPGPLLALGTRRSTNCTAYMKYRHVRVKTCSQHCWLQ
jgi:hypothetical protein